MYNANDLHIAHAQHWLTFEPCKIRANPLIIEVPSLSSVIICVNWLSKVSKMIDSLNTLVMNHGTVILRSSSLSGDGAFHFSLMVIMIYFRILWLLIWSNTVVCSSLGTLVQKEKAKSLNKEQTTTPQVLYKPWCGLLYSLPKYNLWLFCLTECSKWAEIHCT